MQKLANVKLSGRDPNTPPEELELVEKAMNIAWFQWGIGHAMIAARRQGFFKGVLVGASAASCGFLLSLL